MTGCPPATTFALVAPGMQPVLAALTSSGSIFSPESPHAQAITDLFVVTLWICAAIFAVVAGLVGYSLCRYRWREGEPEPEQLAGNKTVEIVWTLIPCAIVLLLFGLTVRAMGRSDPPPNGAPELIVVGHQWWWEVRDPKNGFVTANEIHIPVGRPISVELDTTDVLHEFWVPQLTRKMTTVPGARNHIWMQADKPGVYEGVCSEFCGTQHAWMRFQVVAEPREQYDAWARDQAQPAPPMAGDAARGRDVFRQMTCVSCHSVRETILPKNSLVAATINEPGLSTAAVDSARSRSSLRDLPNAGPDLTHVASRRQLGSGVIANNRENLRRWLADPQKVKPGVKMPNFKLTDQQIDDLVAYFETLK